MIFSTKDERGGAGGMEWVTFDGVETKKMIPFFSSRKTLVMTLKELYVFV